MSKNEQLKLLRTACAERSQADVARALGCSAGTVNMVLKGSYPNPEKWLQRVEEVFGSTRIECPVFGCEITLGRCADERRRIPRYTNPVARLLTETCPKCPNRR
ncbi:helix-turn-helix domain-containing protein [Pseudomonas sp.]|uniref:helix-turn-helix domain-containing protein n=1 Tax=Pseudomonas sp. TaxID=306 RepID=UPI003D0CAF84